MATFLERVGTAQASVLLLDYDGTLAPFKVNRNQAYPYPEVIPILKEIIRGGKTRVIILSGRPILELRVLLAPMDSVEIWGAHGMEHQSSDGNSESHPISEENTAYLEEAEKWVVSAGLRSRAEMKPGGIAIHWRGLSPGEARRVETMARQEWAQLPQRSGLKLLSFEAGLELRVSHPDKGDVVRSVLAGLDSNVPVAFLGDDITDEDAFAALGGNGLSVLVKTDYRETLAGAWIRPPDELIGFLEGWLRSVSG